MALCLALSPSPAARAADSPAPTASASAAPKMEEGSFGEVCGPALGQSGDQAEKAGLTQKREYCKAAKSAEEGADANSMMWKVWAGVAAVCMYACVASFVDAPTNEYLCMGVTVAGGVTDAIITKEFTTALMAIGGAGVGYAANAATSSEGAKKQKDIGACINAAMAGLQTYMKFNSMKMAESSYKRNFDLARTIGSKSDAAASGGGSSTLAAADAATSSDSKTSAGDDAAPSTWTATAEGSGCSSKDATASSILSCAIAKDTNLPKFVSSPKFPNQFQKASGMALPDFFAKSDKPTSALSSAMGGGLSNDQSSKLAAVLQAVEQRVDNQVDGATYAGGGGGGGGGGGSEPALGDMMAGLLSQLMPQDKKKDEATGVNAVAFGPGGKRGLAANAEDPKVSIFDRVSRRYLFVGQRMTDGGQP